MGATIMKAYDTASGCANVIFAIQARHRIDCGAAYRRGARQTLLYRLRVKSGMHVASASSAACVSRQAFSKKRAPFGARETEPLGDRYG